MPRIGQNPLKWTPVNRHPERITITTVVYIPELTGFWANALDILRLCFDSLYENTALPFDLMVLDNGSCTEVVDYLLESKASGRIQFLILSKYNLRKLGALNVLLAAAPGEIISFSDSDVYFMPGWLKASIEVMEAFPEAGQVSALPTVDKASAYCSATYEGINEEPTLSVETGTSLIPERFIEAHRLSLGKSKEAYQKTVGHREDVRITRNGTSAYVSAQDFQFTTRKEIVQRVLPLKVTGEREYYDPIYSPVFEARLNELGYWRLSTTDYLIHHLGNMMPTSGEDFTKSILQHQPDINANGKQTENYCFPLGQRLTDSRYFRRFLKRVNSLTYRLLYER